jgi:class 3 adenylate cyclase
MRDDTTDDQPAAGAAEEAVPAILVASGPAAVSLLTGMLVTVLGDATNVAFRLSGLAGRDGRPDVLVTDAVHRATSASFAFSAPSTIRVKGRTRAVETLGASRSPEGRPAS